MHDGGSSVKTIIPAALNVMFVSLHNADSTQSIDVSAIQSRIEYETKQHNKKIRQKCDEL